MEGRNDNESYGYLYWLTEKILDLIKGSRKCARLGLRCLLDLAI